MKPPTHSRVTILWALAAATLALSASVGLAGGGSQKTDPSCRGNSPKKTCPGTADTAPPVVDLTSPTADTVAGTVTVVADAADDVAVQSVSFQVGTTVLAEDDSGPYSVDWDTSRTQNGQHTITATARDAAGNASTAQRSLTVANTVPDTTPPSAPAGLAAANVSQTGLTLTWKASSDDVGVTGYDVFRGGTKVGTVTSLSSGQTGLTCETTYSFGVEAFDAAGNRSPRSSIQVPTAACPPPPPPPPPPPASTPKLTWAPPALVSPVTVAIRDTGQAAPSLPGQNPNQPWVVYLDPTKDYVLDIGHRTDDGLGNGGTLSITGGRNVVVIGGRITPKLTTTSWQGRGFTFEKQTGTVHVEGVQIDGGGGTSGAGDAFLLVAGNATFQIQNVRAGVSGPNHDFSRNHPDIIQTASAKEVRIDRLTGITDYQGFYWNWDLIAGNHPPSVVIAKNVNFVPDSSGKTRAIVHDSSQTTYSCTNCWMRPGVSWDDAGYQLKLNEVALTMDSVGTVVKSPWRITGFDGQVRTAPSSDDVGRRQGDYIEWPSNANLANERWYWGVPPQGDFVPAGVAGVGYVSPGYLG